MLILRYFVFVGGGLLAVLFACDAVLPKPPGTDTKVAAADLPLIRIHSERKWPKAIVFDTNMAPIAPVAVVSDASVTPTSTDDISAKARVHEAFAQLPEPKTIAAQPKTPQAAPQPKRKYAKARTTPRPLMLLAQQPHFGLFQTW